MFSIHRQNLKTTMVFFGLIIAGFFSSPCIGSETNEIKVLDLFNGKDLSGWHGLDEENNDWMIAESVSVSEKNKKLFKIEEGQGVLVNGKKGRTTNLLSDYEHGDCQLHIEFCVPHESNSGVYLQGQYEIQILDSYNKKPVQYSDCGGIYARYRNGKTFEGHPPRENVSKAPGKWQSFDIVFQAPRFNNEGEKTENAKFVLVKHNGVIVHENVELTGPTRASLNGLKNVPEKPVGPLMLQGDHGPVAYRNIKLITLH